MKFKYKAITISGNEQSGVLEASSKEKAIEILQRHHLVVISIYSIRETSLFTGIQNFVFRNVGDKKIVLFSKELSVLLSSGVSLIEALQIQQEQETHPVFKEQLLTLVNMVDDGEAFSVALARFPNTFSDFYVNIVRSGEASGRMQESLMHLADYVEKRFLLISKVRNAMLYPVTIMVFFVIIGIVMMAFVVPQLTAIFKENAHELPLPTKVLITVSSFMNENFIIFAVALVVGVLLLLRYIKTEKGKEQFDTLQLSLPGVKDLFRKLYTARFADNLAILIASGVPIVESLEISAKVAGNTVYRNVIYNSADEVRIGGSIAYTFEHSEYVPKMLSKMLRIGEKTGKVDSVLADVANFYTKEVDIAVDGLNSIIEPVLLFIVGIGVAGIVMAIMLPIFQMSEFI